MEAPVHSGAARITQLRMRPLSLAERDIQVPTVSLNALLSGAAAIGGSTEVKLEDYVEEIVASGFPAIRELSGRARRAQLDGYIDRVVQRDIPEMGTRLRRPAQLRAWLVSYAAATAAMTSYTAIGSAVSGDGTIPARTTVNNYRELLTHLWLLDQVPAWTPQHNVFKNLAAAPKHFLADPALAARLLNLDEGRLLSIKTSEEFAPHDGTNLGNLFEALVALSLQTYASASDAAVSHFRTPRGDHEVDFIVHRGDENVVGVEVKLSKAPDNDAVQHLLWLKEQIGGRMTDMVLVTTGSEAYRRADGVAIVPLALLGP
jgi:predicted AAA+ superfamily ATPase